MTPASRKLSLTELLNMSFGFLGIQFGLGLQMANMSAIYEYLGAKESEIPILWLAAPLTGLLVQPIIGYYSDRTWTRLGRRRPYFLAGAILASASLVAMPNATSLWVAAALLWILDASVNVSMEPFRAFVGDLVPPAQRQTGFAMQSLLIGLGAVLSSSLPWMLTHLGLAGGGATAAGIPRSVEISFYIGAVAFLGAVVWTVVSTREHPPTEPLPAEGGGPASAFRGIMAGFRDMPLVMRRLAPVQFFTWLGLFCLWIYFTPAVARTFFHATTAGTPEYQRGVEWAGLCLSVYNGVAFVAAFGLVALGHRGVSAKKLHTFGLLCAAAGFLSVGVWSSEYGLFASMTAVGIGWATILSMPYALLSQALPPAKMGFYMGVFNFFIVLPQILATNLLGPIMQHLLGGQPLRVVVLGGFCFLVAAAALFRVPSDQARA